MSTLSRKAIVIEGAIAGLIGGAVFASAQTLAAAITDMPPGAPWQFFASFAAGGEGIAEEVTFTGFLVGAVVHFGLSTLFGAFFGWIVSRINRPVRNDLRLELTGGVLYGLVLWVINVQILGRFLYPWYLELLNPAVQAVIHALFFGVPLATWLALRIRDVETPGVHAARHRMQTSSGDEEWARLQNWEAANRGTREFTHERQPGAPDSARRREGEAGRTLH